MIYIYLYVVNNDIVGYKLLDVILKIIERFCFWIIRLFFFLVKRFFEFRFRDLFYRSVYFG